MVASLLGLLDIPCMAFQLVEELAYVCNTAVRSSATMAGRHCECPTGIDSKLLELVNGVKLLNIILFNGCLSGCLSALSLPAQAQKSLTSPL